MNTRLANVRHARQCKVDALKFNAKLIAVALVACAIGLAISQFA